MLASRRPTDQQLEATIARMLLLGISLAAVVVLAGGFLYLRNPQLPMPDYMHFRPATAALSSVAGTVRGALHANPPSIIQLGLMVLIATPIARVFFCVIGFARQRDRLYTLISVAVLTILLYSLLHH